MLKEKLQSKSDLQKYLFIRGFLVTDKDIQNTDEFPFYNNWKKEKHGKYWYLAHKLTGMHFYEDIEGRVFFLMGHAYNPYSMEHRETEILKRIAQNYGTENYIESLNELTGIYVTGVAIEEQIHFHVDASGMQSACYAKIGEAFYLSSHCQLIADVCNLKMDPFAEELINYKWYGRVMGPYMPADMTSYAEVKRVVPSIMYQYDGVVSHHRFWFTKSIEMADTPESYNAVIQAAAEILKKNMILISRKWEKPGISLTGGIDSNTTFAAANGLYDQFEAFSYLSAKKEEPDAEAARKIAEAFHVKYTVYHIPENAEDLSDYELKVEIQAHNSGYAAKGKANESRKKIYLEQNCPFDVEVKSWTSETIRAYWYKHFGRKSFPKLSAKLYRNLYKIFITNRKLAHKVDKVFREYIIKFEYDKIPPCYPPADIHYNEVTWGSWGGMNISEMKYCFDLTIAYNNRSFLDLLFRIPLDKRISDQHHLDMKKYLNPELYDMGIRVVNMHETAFRAFALNVIFTINSILPF